MAKQKKKRTKTYHGVDATINRPTITRLSAANRNPVSQWWFEKKRFLKPVLIVSAVALAIIWMIVELFRIIGGS